ncbi:hypothetical protein [Streptomyces sp. KR80]|uniref:hypothetical protein n=1 Tax=Streptomyces sp. KR80 TaxID=3457426 RepID=UPI003FD5F586
MNPSSGRRPPHLDPGEATKGQGQEAKRAASEWRDLRAKARRVVAGYARDAEDLVLLLEALELDPGTDARPYRAGRSSRRDVDDDP